MMVKVASQAMSTRRRPFTCSQYYLRGQVVCPRRLHRQDLWRTTTNALPFWLVAAPNNTKWSWCMVSDDVSSWWSLCPSFITPIMMGDTIGCILPWQPLLQKNTAYHRFTTSSMPDKDFRICKRMVPSMHYYYNHEQRSSQSWLMSFPPPSPKQVTAIGKYCQADDSHLHLPWFPFSCMMNGGKPPKMKPKQLAPWECIYSSSLNSTESIALDGKELVYPIFLCLLAAKKWKKQEACKVELQLLDKRHHLHISLVVTY